MIRLIFKLRHYRKVAIAVAGPPALTVVVSPARRRPRRQRYAARRLGERTVAGLAERSGVPFRFMTDTSYAFPMMLVSIAICHVDICGSIFEQFCAKAGAIGAFHEDLDRSRLSGVYLLSLSSRP